jgi:DNA-binding transcriptional MocR family regulator
VLEQLVLSRLLGRREELLAHRRQTVRAARDTLVEAVRRDLPDWRFVVPQGGLALWCELPAPLSSALCTAAERQGVLLAPGPRFAVETGLERYLRLPYTLGPDQLTDAVARIAVAWQEAQRQRSTSARGNVLVA